MDYLRKFIILQMNNIKLLAVIFILFFMSFCQNISKKSESANENIEKQWFENGNWRQGLTIIPANSINIYEFKKQYDLNKNLWERAFDFLKDSNLADLKPGKYELVNDSLYAIIQEYTTLDLDDTRYEAHKKFADIQYLIHGSERIGIAKLDTKYVTEPYDSIKDIGFYDLPGNNYRLADQHTFFIFFPEDAHRPCIRIEKQSRVKKIVFKVRVN